MRGLFYHRTHYDDPRNAGVVNKCYNRAKAFQAYDCQVDTIFFSQKGLRMNERAWGGWLIRTPKGSLGHLLLYFVFADILLLHKLPFKSYQFILIRHMPMHPGFIFFLYRLKRKYPHLEVILDFPTWPYDRELGIRRSGLFLRKLDGLFRKQLKHYVTLALHSGPEQDIWGIPTLQIADGIQAEDFPLKVLAGNEHSLALVFAGSVADWHGLDRVLRGLANYYAGGKNGSTKVSLTIIGQGGACDALRRMTQQWGLEAYVHFVGTKNTQQMRAYYQNADLAVGSLARHRIGLTQGTPLKHREYCAAGLPFVFAGADTDFDPSFPYALQVPADDTPLDLVAVQQFYQKISNEPNFRGEMQAFARHKLSWTVKVRPIVAYLHRKVTN